MAYPPHWESEIIEDIPAFYDPEGAGALQVVAVRRDGEPFDLKIELDRWFERQGMNVPDERIVAYNKEDGTECLVCETTKDDRFWMIQVMGRESKMLMVFYNADEVPDLELAELLSVMIKSVQIYAE